MFGYVVLVPRLTASGEEIEVGLGNKEKVGGMDD